MKRYLKFFCNHLCKHKVIFPVTFTLKKPCCIVPVPHEQAYNIISLFFQYPCCNTRIYSA